METLVEIAKRLGIKPDPKMDWRKHRDCCRRIREEFTGESFKNITRSMWDTRYDFYKKAPKTVSKEEYEQLKKNVKWLKVSSEEGVRIHNQDGRPVSVDDDDVFVWHSAKKKGKSYKERMQIALKIEDRGMAKVFKELDQFILKYGAGFKVTDIAHSKRTDTLNIYFTDAITPEMTSEIYSILKDHLRPEYA